MNTDHVYDPEESIYLCREPECGCIIVVCVDSPNPTWKKHTAKAIASAIKDGLEISHITLEEWKNLVQTAGVGCKKNLSLRECRKSRHHLLETQRGKTATPHK